MAHRHAWAPACPIAPAWDKGNRRARRVWASPKLAHYGCDCGAVKTERRTTRRCYLMISRPGAGGGRRLWSGRHTLTRG
jgi:hypothetical protein